MIALCFISGLEVTAYQGNGYSILSRYQSWRVAVITYAERLNRRNINRLERHMKTDEVFVLMTGTTTLLIGSTGWAD